MTPLTDALEQHEKNTEHRFYVRFDDPGQGIMDFIESFRLLDDACRAAVELARENSIQIAVIDTMARTHGIQKRQYGADGKLAGIQRKRP